MARDQTPSAPETPSKASAAEDQLAKLKAENRVLKSENNSLRETRELQALRANRASTAPVPDSAGVVQLKGPGAEPEAKDSTREKYNKTFRVVHKSGDPKPTAVVVGVCDESEAIRIVRLRYRLKSSKDARFVCETLE